ncbi:MAG: PAS domain S-box protein [Acidimicrobiia bacterium]|nr:PAS domain S-box protein [Acidimicrobiia bacterium]
MNEPEAAEGQPYEAAEMVEAMLRAATEHAIIGTDVDGTIVVFNTGAERLLGYQAEEVLGRTGPMRFHDPGEVESRAAELGVAPGRELFGPARGTESETQEWTYLRKDGGRVPVSLTVSAVLDAQGRRRGYVGIARDLTAEKRAEAERARSTDQFLRIFEAAPLPVLVTRAADGLVKLANPAFESLAGWSVAELVGRTVTEMQLWAEPDHRPPVLAKARQGGGFHDQEEQLRTRFGDLRRVQVAVEVIEVAGEECLLTIFHDITEQLALDSALRDSDERLRAILDAAPAVVSLKDAEGRYLLVNRWFEASFGRRAADVVGQGIETVYPADVAARIRALDERVRASGTETTFEQVLPHVDGTEHTYVSLKFPLRNAAGEAYAICTISTDVTEVKEVEEALRDSEERFLQLAETIDEVFMLVSFDPLAVLYVNPAFERITAVARPRFLADPSVFLDAVHPEDRDHVVHSTLVGVERGEEVEFEYRLRWPDGTDRWARSLVRPVEEPGERSGEPRRWATTVTDITLQKEAELAMRHALADAERANRAKSDFLSRMSHELRTPLNAILGFGQLLELDEQEPDRRESVEQILKAGRHLLALINEILEISRIESGQLRMSVEAVDLAAVVGEALDMFRPLTSQRSVQLGGRPEAGSWGWVLADHQRLKQVVLNLLSNAVKYNRDGGSVRARVDLSNAEVTVLSVQDTGIGIPDEDLERVFVPFDRLGADRWAEEGTGLGLTLSKGLVEAMGGRIGVESEVGEGTRFWVELRRASAPAHHPALANDLVDAGLMPVVERTVLYVEDNLSNVRLVERLLARRPGVRLLTAMQGSMALDLISQHQLDLVLLDLNLPDISGEEVLRRLVADHVTDRTPVVIISADAMPRQISRLVALGAADYLAKPVDLDRFYTVVDRLLAR